MGNQCILGIAPKCGRLTTTRWLLDLLVHQVLNERILSLFLHLGFGSNNELNGHLASLGKLNLRLHRLIFRLTLRIRLLLPLGVLLLFLVQRIVTDPLHTFLTRTKILLTRHLAARP